MLTSLDARALSRAAVSASGLGRVRGRIEDPGGQVAAAPCAESFDQPLARSIRRGNSTFQVDEVAVDDDGQPEDHHCHEQGQQRPGEPRVNPPAQGAVSRQDRIGQEHGQDQGTEQRSQLLEQVPASGRAQHPGGQRVERDEVTPQSSPRPLATTPGSSSVGSIEFRTSVSSMARETGRRLWSRIDSESPRLLITGPDRIEPDGLSHSRAEVTPGHRRSPFLTR